MPNRFDWSSGACRGATDVPPEASVLVQVQFVIASSTSSPPVQVDSSHPARARCAKQTHGQIFARAHVLLGGSRRGRPLHETDASVLLLATCRFSLPAPRRAQAARVHLRGITWDGGGSSGDGGSQSGAASSSGIELRDQEGSSGSRFRRLQAAPGRMHRAAPGSDAGRQLRAATSPSFPAGWEQLPERTSTPGPLPLRVLRRQRQRRLPRPTPGPSTGSTWTDPLSPSALRPSGPAQGRSGSHTLGVADLVLFGGGEVRPTSPLNRTPGRSTGKDWTQSHRHDPPLPTRTPTRSYGRRFGSRSCCSAATTGNGALRRHLDLRRDVLRCKSSPGRLPTDPSERGHGESRQPRRTSSGASTSTSAFLGGARGRSTGRPGIKWTTTPYSVRSHRERPWAPLGNKVRPLSAE